MKAIKTYRLITLLYLIWIKVQVIFGLDCQSIFAFNEHSCILTTTQQLKCWGRNDLGSLGYEHTIDLGDNTNEMGEYLPYVDVNSNIQTVQGF